MNEELFDKIRQKSEQYRLDPPKRVWNRIEYRLDRYDFNRKDEWRRKLLFASSVAAMIIFIVAAIFVLKQDGEPSANQRSAMLLISNNVDAAASNQVYNVHDLNGYYDKLKVNENSYANKKIKVNYKHKS